MMTFKRRALLQAAGLLGLLPRTAAAAAEAGLRFPRDFGAHPASRLEWWYLTGLLAAPGAEARPRWGYQLTFFRLRGPAPDDHPSRLAARQLLLAHVALSDLDGRRLLHEQRLARALPGLAEASEQDCAVNIRDWSLRREGDVYLARFDLAATELELRLQTTQPVLLQGQAGISRKGPRPEQFSRYYSQVQLRSQGTLRRERGAVQALQGRSWLDHEWSDQLLGEAQASERAVGWDWAGINLDDGGALTIFQLRRADGSRLWAGGSWRRPDGRTEDFAPEQLRLRPLRHWRSPLSGADYPLEWALDTPLGALRLAALFDAQEIDARGSTGMRYWEGAAALRSAEGRPLGQGYLELTGYAGKLSF
ncbi:carotenoid 1,2-hydratase [Roseateles violae]|uniref:Carotenoid 1,2-hydratase n=1 Tax=Roseateles violae TaxID=3058042 RepID=A0ABT8DQI1_9BURK|nr:carotenoid 1,2-hydratase [Pelomonas sp. PFR6]MDN3920606.1 carotenoid 1,2-hydratase [Pelomonas sp. PFR6]